MGTIEIILANSSPGATFNSSSTGYKYEKREDGDWEKLGTGEIFTDLELAQEAGDSLE